MNEITTTRANPLVDPVVHVWHAEVPIYLFLGGLVAGLMVLAGLWRLGPERKSSRALSLLPWMAPLLLTVGMLFLWLDLENRWNAYRFYLTMQPTSPMSWGSWILVAVYPVSMLMAWSAMPSESRAAIIEGVPVGSSFLQRLDTWALARERTLGWMSVILGASLGIYTGVLLGTMSARPLWNSAVLGPLFLVSGVSSAAAFMLLYRVSDTERLAIGRLDMGLIVAEALLIALWLVALSSGGASSRAAASLLLGGPYTAAFWTLVVTMGLVTPVAAEWIESRHGLHPGRIPAVLVLMGGFALRWIVVYAGQESAIVMQTALR